MWGSYYFVGARAALAVIWYGVQRRFSKSHPLILTNTLIVFSGSSFMANILRCIFGHKYTDMPNHIPKSIGITTAGMLAFFLFWLVHFPFCAFRPYQLRGFFWFKSIIVLPAVFGLFIFCMVNTKSNLGSLYSSSYTGNKGWFIIYAINSGLGNTATLITNQPDIARWSKTKSGAQWSQLITNPIAVTVSASLGILSTAAINNSWFVLFPYEIAIFFYGSSGGGSCLKSIQTDRVCPYVSAPETAPSTGAPTKETDF